MQLADDIPARRVRLSLERKKYEALLNAGGTSEPDREECGREAVQSRLRKRLLELQKGVVLSELKRSCASPAQRQQEALLTELEEACDSLQPGASLFQPSSFAMSEVSGGTNRVRQFAADSACNVHLCDDEGDLRDATVFHFKVVGTAGVSNVTKTGTVVRSGMDVKGEKVDFKFKCSALPVGLSMNLLSISQLLTDGSGVHPEQGNSYILVNDRLSRHVRKVILEESNGLFFLPLEIDGGHEGCDSLGTTRAHLAAAAKKMLCDTKNLSETAVGEAWLEQRTATAPVFVGGTSSGSVDPACAFVSANSATLEL